MIAATVLAACAALLLVRAPTLSRLKTATPIRRRSRVLAWGWWAVPGIGAGALAGVAVAGRAGAALGASGMIVAGAATWVVMRHRRRLQGVIARDSLREACLALATEVETGRVPPAALSYVAADFPVLAHAAATVELGGDVAGVLRDIGRQWDSSTHALAGAWVLAERSGAPLASSFRAVAGAMTSTQLVEQTVDSELAAPRATGRVLAFLPLGGLGLGYFFGGDPVRWLVTSAIGNGCLVGGCALAAAGLVWSEKLSEQRRLS